MKRIFSVRLAVFATISSLLLASCSSTKSIGVNTKKTETNIVDWSNRNLDVVAKPEWLKKLVVGNSDLFKKEFGVEKDAIVKFGIAGAKTRDASIAASRVNYNAMRAEEIKKKVVSEAAAKLNNEGYTEAIANAAFVAKLDLSGHQLVTQFWQKIESYDKKSDEVTTEFICYSVYKISREDWTKTLKGYLSQVIPAIPDSQAQVKMAQTIQSLYEDTAKEKEISQQAALAQFRAQEEEARVKQAEAAAQVAKNNSVAAVEQAKRASNNVDWASTLSKAAENLY